MIFFAHFHRSRRSRSALACLSLAVLMALPQAVPGMAQLPEQSEEERNAAEAERARQEEQARAEAERVRQEEERAKAEAERIRQEEERARAEAERVRQEQEKARAEAERAAVRQRLAAAAAQATRLLEQLIALDIQRFHVGQTIAATDREIAALQASMQGTEHVVARLEDEVEKVKAASNERARRIYKKSPASVLATLVNAETWGDLVKLSTFWRSLGQWARKFISHSVRLKEDLAAHKTGLARNSEELGRKLEELRKLQEGLEKTTQAREGSLAELKKAIEEARAAEKAMLAAGVPAPAVPGPCLPGLVDRDRRLGFLLAWYLPATGEEPFMPPKLRPSGIVSTGLASWYGPGFDGCNSASMTTFRETQMTAASLSLPFGTFLKVTNGTRSVVVVITDRGPYIPGRELDLSKAAAQAIGVTGVSPVNMEILLPAEPSPPFP